MAVVAPAIKSCSRISTLEFSLRLLPSQSPRFAKAVAMESRSALILQMSPSTCPWNPRVSRITMRRNRAGVTQADLTVATADLTAVDITDATRLTKLPFDSSIHYPQTHLA